MTVARRIEKTPPPGSSARFCDDARVDDLDLAPRRDGGAGAVAAAALVRAMSSRQDEAGAVLAQQPLLEAGLPDRVAVAVDVDGNGDSRIGSPMRQARRAMSRVELDVASSRGSAQARRNSRSEETRAADAVAATVELAPRPAIRAQAPNAALRASRCFMRL